MAATPPKVVFSALLALAAAVPAAEADGQNVTVPRLLDGVEGGSGSLIPFGFSTPVRYQCIYDADQLPFSGAKLITEIRFRPDWNMGLMQARKAFLRMDIDMSTSDALSDAASTDFDENHGIDRARVANFLQIALPAQPAIMNGSGPRSADIVIPLQTPFWYGRSPVRGATYNRSLVIDLQIISQPSGRYYLDSPFTCDSQAASFGSFDPPCVNSLGQELLIESSNDIRAGGNVSWSVENVIPNNLFGVIVWFDTGGDWVRWDPTGRPIGLQPLPAPLHPAAVGCYLNVRIDRFVMSGFADGNGMGTLGFAVPSDRTLVGQSFFAQAIAQDISANPFAYVTSRGERSLICGPLGCARIYNLGNATATSGSVTFGAASVIEIR